MVKHPDVIDVHTHVFNARYLPLEGILTSFVKKPSGWSRALAHALASILNEATGSSFDTVDRATTTPTSETDTLLEEIWVAIEAELEARTRGFLVAAGAQRPPDEYVTDQLSQDPLLAALLDANAMLEASNDDPDEPAALLPRVQVDGVLERSRRERLIATRHITRPLVGGRASAIRGGFGFLKKGLIWLVKKVWKLIKGSFAWWDDLDDYLAFIQRLLMSEREIFRRLQGAYAPGQRVGSFVHAMMDMELAYTPPTPPRYPFAEQERRMLRLAGESGGPLIGLTAFDPRRKVPFRLPMGFAGVKFYPAMGYRPWGNEDQDVESAVRTFYVACVEADIPVFTHCTPRGFQAYSGAGLNAHPKYWQQVLAPDAFPSLRLNLAHAGGGTMKNRAPGTKHTVESHGWYATPDKWGSTDNFARIVVELCNTRDNVYCDVGHLAELAKGDAGIRERFELNFTREWQRGSFARRCMFGSDHHMAAMINSASALLDYFRDLFAREKLSGFDDFCAGNARRYLKL